MHTSTLYFESTFGAEHGKGSQTGCVPDTTPVWLAREHLLGISDTEYIAQRAPGCARVACPQLRVAAITDKGVVQVRYIRAHIRNTRQILRPEDAQKTLIGLTQEDLRQVHKDAAAGGTEARLRSDEHVSGRLLILREVLTCHTHG